MRSHGGRTSSWCASAPLPVCHRWRRPGGGSDADRCQYAACPPPSGVLLRAELARGDLGVNGITPRRWRVAPARRAGSQAKALPCQGIAQFARLGHYRRMEIRAELVIDAPAEDAWVVVGERFGQISEWASAITQSVIDGPPAAGRVRTCQVAGFGPIPAGVITERLVRFDPDARSLSYELGVPEADQVRAQLAATDRTNSGSRLHLNPAVDARRNVMEQRSQEIG